MISSPFWISSAHDRIDLGLEQHEVAHHHRAAMRRLERDPAAERERRLDGDAVERHGEIGARKAVAMDIAGHGRLSAERSVDLAASRCLGPQAAAEAKQWRQRKKRIRVHAWRLLVRAHGPVTRRPASPCSSLNSRSTIVPADRLHECFDIGRRLGAEIDVIGVLVHVERENRRAAGQRMAVVGCPLIDKLAVARRPRQQHPARAAAERLSHRDEFRSPALIGSKVA